MNGWMVAWIVGFMDPWTDVREKGHGEVMGDWMEGSMDGWEDTWIDRCMVRWVDGQVSGRLAS